MTFGRRTVLTAAVAGAAALAAPRVIRAQGQSELRFIPHADLASLDPVWTTADITRNHGNMIYDLLYGLDADFQPHPQMVDGHRIASDGLTWELTLREGLRFHDGEKVLARDCVACIRRWGKRDAFGSAMMSRTDEVSAPSDRVIRIRLRKPFALLPVALAQPNCVIMPERIAKTDANVQISDPTGSGPFRFLTDERIQGSRSVYAKFDGYVPRPEGKTDFLAGPRIVHFDRVVWTFQPDPATSAAALSKGEFDWWENPPIDLVALLRSNRGLSVDVKNRMGGIGCIRFNHLYSPFDNPAIRRLVLSAVNQHDFMEAYAGAEPELYRTGVGLFTPGTPMATDVGVEAIKGRTDFDKIKQELAAAGYKGEKIVLLAPTTIPSLNAESQVAGDLLRCMGFNVDYQALEWGMVVARRASKEPPEKGGWHIFITKPDQLQQRVRAGADCHPERTGRMVRLAQCAQAGGVARSVAGREHRGGAEAYRARHAVSGMAGRAVCALGTDLWADGVQQDADRCADGLAGVPRGAASLIWRKSDDRADPGYHHQGWRDGDIHLPSRAWRTASCGVPADGRARHPRGTARHDAPAGHRRVLRAAAEPVLPRRSRHDLQPGCA
jgi:peptide/nickel transport system substrate-binding protein